MSDVAQSLQAKKEPRVGLRTRSAHSKTTRCVSFPELVQTHFIRESALAHGEVMTVAGESLLKGCFGRVFA